MITYINKCIPKQPPENEFGNKEYKRYLINHPKNCPKKFIEKRATQMLFRLIEGEGKALYLFGVDDDGKIREMNKKELDTTIYYLKKIVLSISAKIKKLRIYISENGFICTVRIVLPNIIFNNIMDNINLQE